MRIYLDNISGARPSEQVVSVLMPYFEHSYGSLSAPHQMGQELVSPVEKSVQALYELFGVSPEYRFVFTSSGAESKTQVIDSVVREVVKKRGKNHFVVSSLSEAPMIYAISRLEEDSCYLQMTKASSRGFISLDAIEEAISPRTALVSLPFACALTGVIQPLEKIAALCKQRAILLHVDATHAIGKWPLDALELADFVTFNGEQFHAPRGTGGLFAKKEAILYPLIAGEDEQIRLRGGSVNVPFLIALGQAAGEAKQYYSLYCTEVARLRASFEENLLAAYPEAIVLFKDEERLPHCTAIAFPGIHSELLAFALSRKGVYACMGGGPFQKMENVLQASGVEKNVAQCALSFSLSKDTQEAELERAVSIISDVAKRLRRLSLNI